MAVAVSGIGIGTRCFGTWVRDRDSTRCTSVIVLKLIGNSIKGKNKIHLKFIFSVESMLPILLIHCSVLHYERIDTIRLPYVGVAHGQSTVLFWPSVHVTCHKPNELNTRDIITCHSQFWTLTELAWKRFDFIFFPSSYSLFVSLYIVSVPLCTYLDSHKCKLSPYHGKILRTP